MSAGTTGLRLVVDVTVDPEELLRLNSPSTGVLAALVSPGPRGVSQLAQDLLWAFGKDLAIDDSRRSGTHALADVIGWLVANEVRDIIVVHAQCLMPTEIASLGLLTELLGLGTWFVATAYPTGNTAEMIADWNPTCATKSALPHRVRNHEPRPSPRTASKENHSGLPTVPRRPFPLFLSESKRLMRGAALKRVVALYEYAFDLALGFFATGCVDPESVVRAMHEVWAAPGDVDGEARQVVAYAFQSAGVRVGWFLHLDMAYLEPRWQRAQDAQEYAASQWSQLDKCASTQDAAIASLSAAGLSESQIVEVKLHDVQKDGSRLLVEDRDWPLPHDICRYLRAHYWCRLSDDSGSLPSYVCDIAAEKPISVVAVENSLLRLARLTGVDWHEPKTFWAESARRVLSRGVRAFELT